MAQKAIVAGHICLDIIPNFHDVPSGKFFELFQPGLMLQIGPPLFSTGGPVSNTGLALHLLGIESYLMGKIGNDMYGKAVLSLLDAIDPKLSLGMILDPASTTSYTIIINPPGIDRIFLHHTGANDNFKTEDIDFEKFNEASLFHFGYPPVMATMYLDDGKELTELFLQAKSTGITTSLDMCFPDPGSPGGNANWPVIYRNTLPYVDIFSPSIEEILFTLRREKYFELTNRAGSRFTNLISPDLLFDLSSEFLDMGTKILLIKLGDRGAYLRTSNLPVLENMGRSKPLNISSWANLQIWAPCYKVEVVGTTGSGDATIAGFLCALLRGLSPHDAINSAVAVGAFNVEAADAIGGIRTWDTTWTRINSGWERHPLDLSIYPGWIRDEVHQIWVGNNPL